MKGGVSIVPIRVRYAETDRMGVVHHSVPALWFEDGRTAMMADAGYSYDEVERDGLMLPVVELHVRFRKPAHYGGNVVIQTWIHSYTGMKVHFRNRVLDEKTRETLVDGLVVLGCLEIKTGRPARCNRRLQAFLESGGTSAD